MLEDTCDEYIHKSLASSSSQDVETCPSMFHDYVVTTVRYNDAVSRSNSTDRLLGCRSGQMRSVRVATMTVVPPAMSRLFL